MQQIRRLLPIIAACALLCGCGDYSGGNDSASTQSFVVASGVGGLGAGDQVISFATTVYPLLRDNCSECHAGFGPGTPHIAHADPAVAYSAVVDNQKVNFTVPESSRVVRRLATDFHHCWGSCIENGAEMLLWVNAWNALLDQAGVEGGGAGVDVEGLVSDRLTLADGVEDEGDERFDDGILALWDFKEGSGDTAFDQSGVLPSMDLTLDGTGWLNNYGIEFPEDGRAFADVDASRKIYERIAAADTGSGEYSVETWLIPGNTTQDGVDGAARIVTYSRGTSSVGFTLGQNGYQYVFLNRNVTEGISSRGEPALETYAQDEDLQDTLQHVVITYDRFTGRRIYVDGAWTDDVDSQDAGRLWNWDPRNRLVLGDEISTPDNHWLGKIRFLAIFDRALSPEQVRMNYLAGIGKRLTLTFSLEEWAGTDAYLDFSVTQIDEFSYLFCQPTFRGANSVGLHVENIRIQVNDTIPVEGQAFVNVNDNIREDGQQVSRLCSIIRAELGPDLDSFTIAFEELGRFQSPLDPSVTSYVVPDTVLPDVPLVGIRDFARINATMATLTTVDPRTPAVLASYTELEQQLPSSTDIRSFVSSHQVGVARLAFEYCHELVEVDITKRDAFFGTSFRFDLAPAQAFAAGQSALIIDPLIATMLHHGTVELTDQPNTADVVTELNVLIAELMVCSSTPCNAARTVNIVKGACTSVLASAAVMVY